MGYWGWRPLVFGIFISTWVVGCNIVTDNASPSVAPSNYPDVTLTVGRLPTARVSAAATRAAPTRVIPRDTNGDGTQTPPTYVVHSGDTLADIAGRFDVSVDSIRNENGDLSTLVSGQTLVIPLPTEPTAMLLTLYPPTCYEKRPNHLLCLGQVANPLTFPVESIVIDVRLLHEDGEIYLDEYASLEQTSIPSGGIAAYQTTFHANWGDFTRADATVISAVRGVTGQLVVLTSEDTSVSQQGERLTVQATLINPGDQTVELLRAFLTLVDADGSVTGYRVIDFESGLTLTPGDRMPLQFELTPEANAADSDALLTVEARRIESS